MSGRRLLKGFSPRRLVWHGLFLILVLVFLGRISWILLRVEHPSLPVPPAVREAIRRECRPFRSCVPDTSELARVVEAVGDRRLVFLGEDDHETREFPEIESRLIETLHRRAGFNAVVIEEAAVNCMILEDNLDSLNTGGTLRHVLPLLSQLGAVPSLVYRLRRAGRDLLLAGCDYHCLRSWTPSSPLPLLEAPLRDAGSPLADSLASRGPKDERFLRNRLEHGIHGPSARVDGIESFFRRVRDTIDTLSAPRTMAPRRRLERARRVVRCVLAECRLTRIRDKQRRQWTLRDTLLAEQVRMFLAGEGHHRKVIVVAHAGHVMRARSRYRYDPLDRLVADLIHRPLTPSLGELMARGKGGDFYALGIFAQSTRRGYRIRMPRLSTPTFRGEIRDVFLPRPWQGGFLDLAGCRDPDLVRWVRQEHLLSSLGGEAVWLCPAEQFDGWIVIRKASRG